MFQHRLLNVGALVATLGCSAAAQAESYGTLVSYYVPVECTISHRAVASDSTVAGAVALGALHEYCNAARGYRLVVHYTPGTLRGMVLIAGDERVTLDGSGEAVVARSTMPQIRDRVLSAIPGPTGFDTDQLNFEAVATPFA